MWFLLGLSQGKRNPNRNDQMITETPEYTIACPSEVKEG